jgi:hypothetical protein
MALYCPMILRAASLMVCLTDLYLIHIIGVVRDNKNEIRKGSLNFALLPYSQSVKGQ